MQFSRRDRETRRELSLAKARRRKENYWHADDTNNTDLMGILKKSLQNCKPDRAAGCCGMNYKGIYTGGTAGHGDGYTFGAYNILPYQSSQHIIDSICAADGLWRLKDEGAIVGIGIEVDAGCLGGL